jgi:hypothetical protein
MGTMLTPSVNVVQSSFPDELQGEISGLPRSVSNLGSCLGTAIGLVGLVASALLPADLTPATPPPAPEMPPGHSGQPRPLTSG